MVAEPGAQTRTAAPRKVALPVIGVDFDNTLVSYDRLMHNVAVEWGLLPAGAVQTKKRIRDRIRELPDGEARWRKLQGVVYGPRMHEAVPIDGVADFLRLCKDHGVRLYVASHKSEYGHFDPSGTNIRSSATDWMRTQGFFDTESSVLAPGDVYFESTRMGKVDRIRRLVCTHFIDDLEETFLEGSFPAGVEKVLYSPDGPSTEVHSVVVMSSWKELSDYFFGTH